MEETQKKNWFQRNWKWFVPSGCLTIIVLFGLLIGGIIYFVNGMMVQSEPYQVALKYAQENAEVTQALGKPIDKDGIIMGNISLNGGSGQADMQIPIEGPSGEGKIYVSAHKIAGQWQYYVMECVIDGSNQRINLLE